MHRYLSELGLSPTSRARVEVSPQARSKFAGLLGVAAAGTNLYTPKPWMT
jgi:hypothetical protein